MAATIKDIARKLNISVSTVSYALNGGPRPVPEEVRRKVLETAKELSYRPNRIARSMITGRSQTIGIVPPEVSENVFLSPYMHQMMNGIVNEAGKSHQDLLVFTRYNKTECEELMSVLVDGRVDGVIFIAPHFSHKSVELATSTHLPCVAVSGAPLNGIASFTVNNEDGIRQAMQHLYDLGHRKIAHIAGREDMLDSVLRLQAYRQFLTDKGLPLNDNWVRYGEFQIDGGRRALEEFAVMQERPTAIVCSNDEMAIGAILQAHKMGLQVPRDMSIVGFDGTPACENVYPALTSVAQPISDLSTAAVASLMKIIKAGEPQQSQVFNSRLEVRASTSSPKEDP